MISFSTLWIEQLYSILLSKISYNSPVILMKCKSGDYNISKETIRIHKKV